MVVLSVFVHKAILPYTNLDLLSVGSYAIKKFKFSNSNSTAVHHGTAPRGLDRSTVLVRPRYGKKNARVPECGTRECLTSTDPRTFEMASGDSIHAISDRSQLQPRARS
eukprot:SAG22_NODE_9523_length_585_cov_0.849794_1_plen_108_part_01